MKTLITLLAILGLQNANANELVGQKIHCEGTSRLNNLTVELDYNPYLGTITLQNKGNYDPARIAGFSIDKIDEDSASKNGVTFISGFHCDTRRVNVEVGPYDLIIGPSNATLLMKNEAGEIHDYFRLACTR